MNAPPRQIYASTLSRRQRAWGLRRRRRWSPWSVPLGWLAIVLAAGGTAAALLGHLPG